MNKNVKSFEDQLNDAYRITRIKDGLEFRVTLHGHWNDIESETGERDSIKFLGPAAPGKEQMVGFGGELYVRTARS